MVENGVRLGSSREGGSSGIMCLEYQSVGFEVNSDQNSDRNPGDPLVVDKIRSRK